MIPKTTSHFSLINILEQEPDTTSSYPLGYVDRGKGGTYFLNHTQSFAFIAIIEFLPEKGLRGNHYHQHKHEYFYVQDGDLVGYFWDPENPKDRFQRSLKQGDFFDIKPGLAHAFKAVRKTTAIELSPQAFEGQDHIYVENPF